MPHLPRPRLLLALITAVTVLGGILGLAMVAWFDHEAVLTDASSHLNMLTRVMEANVRGLHQISHANLVRIGERVGDRPLAALKGAAAEREWLDSLLVDLPFAQAVCLRGPDGELILSTDTKSAFNGNSADREYFTLALSQPRRTVIGAMAVNRTLGTPTVTLARAFTDRMGKVIGIAEIVVPTEHFNRLFREINPSPGAVFNIARRDGHVVARFPTHEGLPPTYDINRSPFTEFAKASEGMFRGPAPIDRQERLIGFRHLPDLGLIVASGSLPEQIFRDWTTRTQHATSLFAAALLLVLGLAVVTNESLHQETRLLLSVERNASDLTEALAEKDVLFQEVHHRVKNNLQVISSLLTMQLLHVSDDTARTSLKDALDRIHSMGLVHQTLYERNLAAKVDLGVYFGKLAEALVTSYGIGKGGVTVEVEVEGVLDLERAVPLGMLANEALSNALKHAFSDGRRGTVKVTLSHGESEWRFTVRDDGIGMSTTVNKGIGLSLIRALTRQLNGRSEITSDNGTVVSITFPV
ncbi:Signal transduction histidine kinase [Candidatus Terasakiella magnetica]|nr:Signal transduction histidine kinase [Candidatus Terasakiella magnetica]